MKNLKIKMKMLVGFGIVIILTFGLAIFNIIANLTTINSMNTIHDEVYFMEQASLLSQRIGEMETDASYIYLSFSDRAYAEIEANTVAIDKVFEYMYSLIDSNPETLGDFSAQLDNIQTEVGAWTYELASIHQHNKTLERLIGESYGFQEHLLSLSSGIFDYQIELASEEASQSIDSEARLRRVSRIEQGKGIAQDINAIGAAFDVMFTGLDISRVAEDLAFFDESVAELTEFYEGSALQRNIDMAGEMLEALAAYRACVDEFIVVFNSRERLIDAAADDGMHLYALVSELIDHAQEETNYYVNETIGSVNNSLLMAIIISSVVVVVSVVIALYIASLITKPLKVLQGYFSKAGSKGRLEMDAEEKRLFPIYSKYKDEIGDTMRNATSFVHHIVEVSREIEIIADGDLTPDIEVLSDEDVIGLALQKLLINLNTMFADINEASMQVSTGSKQVAEGAQSLAQGSTEQAASIEQLSASIGDIAQKTKENAQLADRAAGLAKSIMDNAEKGSSQMSEMTNAVNDINKASQSISKVIKVIDDIAFQTNILALNAAVEAARAGQHGKGFAVVAEEVRNLAAKSAEAAKDTSGLIQNSMEKAELGARIAGETAESLTEIVSGINDSTKVVTDIAKSSEEQSLGISQINIGIDQVAQVVQQNSATAEESAAASQQMSSQSTMLEELIAQFKLRNDGGGGAALPPVQHPKLTSG